MIFLNPSILLGLLAASIPIIIHILNFRKLKKVEFSTLAFLKELQKSKIKKIKIKQWLLLLIRTLIIIFLVLAFARPTIDNVSLIGSTSTAKTSSVFIIDNSFSMSYVGDEGSIFNNSKILAKNIISNMENGDEFIFLQSLDSILITTNKESAIKIIDESEINLKLENTINKILKAESILGKSNNINKEIFVFSDFQSSTFKNEIDSLVIESSDNDIFLYSIDMALENTSNYAISNLQLENTIIETNKPLTFSATVYNYSNEETSSFITSLFLNNKRVAQQSITFNGIKEKIVKFETSLNSTGLVEARAEIEEDNIPHDNISYLNFLIPKKIDVLIVYDDPYDIIFLEAALKSSSQSEQISISKIKGTEISDQQLEIFGIIFLISSRFNSQINIGDYIKTGGNLIFIPPSSLNQEELTSLGNKISFLKNAELTKSDIDNNNYLEFGDIEFNHPIFQNLFENNSNNKIESPKIFSYLKTERKSSSIIELINNQTFFNEQIIGKGTLLLFNTSFVLEWSNFPIKGIFAPIISRCVFYLSSSNNKTNNYFIGDDIPIDVRQVTYPIIDLSLPVGNEKINLDQYNKESYLYNKTSISGSYKFYNNKELLSYANVNINTLESDLTKITPEFRNNNFTNIFGEKYLLLDKDDNYIEKIKQARYGTELWKFLLLIALVLALVEMFIARSTKKDLAKIN